MMVFLVVVGVYIYVQLTKKTALTVSFLYNNNDIAYKTQNVFVYFAVCFSGTHEVETVTNLQQIK